MKKSVFIYQKQKKATQSAEPSVRWCLAWHHDSAPMDSLTGWTGGHTDAPSPLMFASREQAIAYATRSGLTYQLEEPSPTPVKGKSYAAQFKKKPPRPRSSDG